MIDGTAFSEDKISDIFVKPETFPINFKISIISSRKLLLTQMTL